MPNINEFSVAIAFDPDDDPRTVSPTWTYLDSVDGIRVQEWSISRGRPNELEPVSAGTASVTIADRVGYFDPTNGGSPVFPNVLPDRQIKIQLFDPVQETWHCLFRGYIEEINIDVRSITYADGAVEHGVLFVTLDLVDAFAWFNDHELMPYPKSGDEPPAGSESRVFYDDTPAPVTVGPVADRIQAVLDDLGWSGALTDVFSGNVKITETTYEPGTTGLTALQDAVDSEFPGTALHFMSKDGVYTFHGRNARFRPDVAEYGINRRTVGDPSVTASDHTIAPIAELSFSIGKTFLRNSVLVVPQDTVVGTPPTEDEIAGQLLEDATSIDAHGKKSLTFTDLLTLEGNATGNTALEECLLFAQYFRDNLKDPLPRITRMVFKSRMPQHRLADPLWKMICRCEISDLLTVKTAHVGGGGFNDGYYVEGIRYTGRPGNDQVHNITLEVDVSPEALFDDDPFEADPDP
jgi:hypothetical protein